MVKPNKAADKSRKTPCIVLAFVVGLAAELVPQDVFKFSHVRIGQRFEFVYFLDDRKAPVLLQEVYDLLPICPELDPYIYRIARSYDIPNIDEYDVFSFAGRVLHDVAQLAPPILDGLDRRRLPEHFIDQRLDVLALRLNLRD